MKKEWRIKCLSGGIGRGQKIGKGKQRSFPMIQHLRLLDIQLGWRERHGEIWTHLLVIGGEVVKAEELWFYFLLGGELGGKYLKSMCLIPPCFLMAYTKHRHDIHFLIWYTWVEGSWGIGIKSSWNKEPKDWLWDYCSAWWGDFTDKGRWIKAGDQYGDCASILEGPHFPLTLDKLREQNAWGLSRSNQESLQ